MQRNLSAHGRRRKRIRFVFVHRLGIDSSERSAPIVHQARLRRKKPGARIGITDRRRTARQPERKRKPTVPAQFDIEADIGIFGNAVRHGRNVAAPIGRAVIPHGIFAHLQLRVHGVRPFARECRAVEVLRKNLRLHHGCVRRLFQTDRSPAPSKSQSQKCNGQSFDKDRLFDFCFYIHNFPLD